MDIQALCRKLVKLGNAETERFVQAQSGPFVIERTHETVPEPRLVLPVPASPVDMSVDEIKRMKPEDRQRALARILNVSGARDRMNALKLAGKTLTESLTIELDYQRAILLESRRVVTKAESAHHNKTESKKARKNGRPKPRPAGTASFRGAKCYAISVTSTEISVRKRKRGEIDLLALNSVR